MSIVERICLAWRAASDGDYVAWEDIPEDATVKIKERHQVRAALRAIKPEDVSDTMLGAFGAEVARPGMGNESPAEMYRRAIAAALAAGAEQ